MSRTTLKARKYYDWQDIQKHFGFKSVGDVFSTTNGQLVTVYAFDEDYICENKHEENQKRISDELGECQIHVCW